MSPAKLSLFITILVMLFFSHNVESQLQVGFYNNSCKDAESIVKEEVLKAFVLASDFMRLQFHDCFVRGCEASVLLNSTATNVAEKDAPVNNPSLRGYDVIDKIKARLEAVCEGVVSCADIIGFAARDSVAALGGPSFDVQAGRRDGRVSLASEAQAELPPPTFNLDQLTQNFASKNLTQDELVILSGAHTVGVCHCDSFTNRLYNYNSTFSQDPSLNPLYAIQLKLACPRGFTNPNTVVPNDPTTPIIVDVNYYRNLLVEEGLFTSDQTLMSNPNTAARVRQYAYNPLLWRRDFVAAIVKMGQIGVLTGNDGEIRRNCAVVNS